MAVLHPAPSVLGACSLTAVVELVCLAHLVLCIYFFANVDSVHSISIVGTQVSPLMQSIVGAFALVGVPIVIFAFVGVIYRIERHLGVYMNYLCASLVFTVFWLICFMVYGNRCTDGSDSESTYACGVENAVVIFWVIMLLLAWLLAIYLVWSTKDWLEKRLETELLRYTDQWQITAELADDCAAEMANELRWGKGAVYNASIPAAQIPRPYSDYNAINTINPPIEPPVQGNMQRRYFQG